MIFKRSSNPKKASEAELIDGCLNKDRRYQEEFYARYSAKMLAVCARYAKNIGEAEDIVHDGFVKAFGKLHYFKGEGSLEGWVRRIMVNTSLEHFRKNKHLQVVEEVENHEDLQVEAKALSKLSADEILLMVQRLPSGFRIVFNLYVIEGYSHKEIAEELGISTGTSKSQLSRARLALQDMIKTNDADTYEEYARTRNR